MRYIAAPLKMDYGSVGGMIKVNTSKQIPFPPIVLVCIKTSNQNPTLSAYSSLLISMLLFWCFCKPNSEEIVLVTDLLERAEIVVGAVL